MYRNKHSQSIVYSSVSASIRRCQSRACFLYRFRFQVQVIPIKMWIRPLLHTRTRFWIHLFQVVVGSLSNHRTLAPNILCSCGFLVCKRLFCIVFLGREASFLSRLTNQGHVQIEAKPQVVARTLRFGYENIGVHHDEEQSESDQSRGTYEYQIWTQCCSILITTLHNQSSLLI